MNNRNIETIRETAIIAMSGGVCLLIAAFFLHEPFRTANFWFGEKPKIDVVVPMGTLVAAITAGVLTYLGYRANTRAELAGRLQKALDLFDPLSPGKSAASVALLQEVAAESSRYRFPVLKSLISFLFELDGAESSKMIVTPETTLAYSGIFPANNLVTNDIIRSIAEVYQTLVSNEEFDGSLILLNTYLSGFRFRNCIFARSTFNRAVIHDTGFHGCDFTESTVYAVVGRDINFSQCDLSGVSMHLSTASGALIPHGDTDVIKFFGCTGLKEATINGVSAEAWQTSEDPFQYQRE